MRHVASTVTIVTTHIADRPFGMVATAVMSLSLHPPSLVLAVNQSASICAPLHERGAFCVNILSTADQAVSAAFSRLKGQERFTVGDWSGGPDGPFARIPHLTSAQAALFCTLESSSVAGSHRLIVGHIKQVIDRHNEQPLLYCDGSYGSFKRGGPGPAR